MPRKPRFTIPGILYLALEASDSARQTTYRELFRGHLDDETLHDIRQALNHELVLGRSYFKEKIEQITNRQTELGAPGRPRIAEDLVVYFVD